MLAGCSLVAKPAKQAYKSIAWQHAVLFFVSRHDGQMA